MAYEIDQYHKIRKQYRKRLDNTIDPSSSSSKPSYSFYKLNENTDITSKKSLTAETHSREIFALGNKPSVIIET